MFGTNINIGVYEVATTNADGCISTAISLTVDAQPALPSAPTIIRDDARCTYSYQAANTEDTFNPATIPNTDPAPFSIIVTNTNGCSATFTVGPEPWPATGAFAVINTGGSTISGMFMAEDPCKCNGDQLLNYRCTYHLRRQFNKWPNSNF